MTIIRKLLMNIKKLYKNKNRTSVIHNYLISAGDTHTATHINTSIFEWVLYYQLSTRGTNAWNLPPRPRKSAATVGLTVAQMKYYW